MEFKKIFDDVFGFKVFEFKIDETKGMALFPTDESEILDDGKMYSYCTIETEKGAFSIMVKAPKNFENPESLLPLMVSACKSSFEKMTQQ